MYTSFWNYYSVDTEIGVEDIHYRLLSDLITGYFGNGGKTVGNTGNIRWKMHFRKYCRLPSQQDCNVLQNIVYLEQNGLIGIGNYSVLKNIFLYVDQRALHEIDDASKLINDIKAKSKNVTSMLLLNLYIYKKKIICEFHYFIYFLSTFLQIYFILIKFSFSLLFVYLFLCFCYARF